MYKLYHYPLCPFSRIVRIALAIYNIEFCLIEEYAWERRTAFLEINPAGTLPILIDEQNNIIPGISVIVEYLEDVHTSNNEIRLMPKDIKGRVEVRRLMDWFNKKFNDEVTRNLVEEKIYRRFMPKKLGGGSPNATAVRAGITNVRTHVQYIGYLIRARKWLAGDELSYADLAAAAHLSCIDYINHVPWDEDKDAGIWYARIKSQPAFRSILTDKIPGMPPAASYADLDF